MKDKKVLIGIGVGIILGASIIKISDYSYQLSREQIEIKARGYGMHYSSECKVIFNKELKEK